MKKIMCMMISLMLLSGNLFANGQKEVVSSNEGPLELTIFESLKKPFDSEYPIFLKATEYTNVTLKGVISDSSSDAKQSFNLMVASGDMADIVAFDRTRIQELALEGAFTPLDDLIDQHAPNIKAFFESRPEIKKHATAADGNIYHIPFIPDGEAASGWFIRMDWLEKLGLEKPTNIDELYNVLKAFREGDPNGNGKADEIPFFNRHNVHSQKLYDLVMLWGAHEEWYLDGDQVKFGPMEPAYKTAYENLAQWYDEGLIDMEIYTRGKTARDVALRENIGGMTHDWFGSTSGYNDKITDIDGFLFAPFAPPANIDGEVMERTVRSKLHWGGWAISSSNEHIIETIKYFDFFFTEEGRRLMNFGIEGETYTMVNGEPIFMDHILNAEGGAVAALREYGCQTATGFQQDFNYEKQWMNPIAAKGVEEYMNGGYFMEQFPILQYTPEEKIRISELMVAINTLRDETSQKWILGAEDVSSGYDDYIESLRKYNIEEAVAIQQAAYNRYIGK